MAAARFSVKPDGRVRDNENLVKATRVHVAYQGEALCDHVARRMALTPRALGDSRARVTCDECLKLLEVTP